MTIRKMLEIIPSDQDVVVVDYDYDIEIGSQNDLEEIPKGILKYHVISVEAKDDVVILNVLENQA